MQDLQSRIKACLVSSGLKGTLVDYVSSEKKEIPNGKLYTYEVDIPERLFISKEGWWSNYRVNSKIEKFNQLCLERIKSLSIKMQYLEQSPLSRTTITKLLILVPIIKIEKPIQLSLFSS